MIMGEPVMLSQQAREGDYGCKMRAMDDSARTVRIGPINLSNVSMSMHVL
jgi:hypothetical protein